MSLFVVDFRIGKKFHLAADGPAGEGGLVQRVRGACDGQRRSAAQGVAAVRLVARLAADATLICLQSEHQTYMIDRPAAALRQSCAVAPQQV